MQSWTPIIITLSMAIVVINTIIIIIIIFAIVLNTSSIITTTLSIPFLYLITPSITPAGGCSRWHTSNWRGAAGRQEEAWSAEGEGPAGGRYEAQEQGGGHGQTTGGVWGVEGHWSRQSRTEGQEVRRARGGITWGKVREVGGSLGRCGRVKLCSVRLWGKMR